MSHWAAGVARAAATSAAAVVDAACVSPRSLPLRLLPPAPQKQALKLAREVVRAARTKPPAVRADILAALRDQFAAGAHLARTDVQLIEHLLRKGAKHLELIRAPTFAGLRRASPPPAQPPVQ